MVRQEIRKFKLNLEGGSYDCMSPCSVNSVISGVGADISVVGSRASFDVEIMMDEAALSMKSIYLFLRGIKGAADVFLGSKLILTVDPDTPSYTINVKEVLRVGSNILSVRFDSASAEELLYSGIAEFFELVRFNRSVIENLHLQQTHSADGVQLDIKLDLLGDGNDVRAVATLTSPTGQIYYAGLTKGEGSILVRDPLYWWPKGMGVQNLYRLTVNLYGESDIEDSYETKLGLRIVKVAGEDNSLLLVNGSKFLPMGATYSTEEYSDLTTLGEKAETFVSAASSAGFNCLIIPLVSARPCEKFYELCDRQGILVIEEYSKIDERVIFALNRNRHHACFGLIDLIGDDFGKDVIRQIERRLPSLAYTISSCEPKYVNSPALPSMKTLSSHIPTEECSLFSRSLEAISEPGAIKNMLLSVADKYPYPSDLSQFAYASALAAVNVVADSVKKSRMTMGASGRAVFNRLCDFNMSISPSAIDSEERWKPLQYYSSRLFTPLAVYAETAEGVVVFSASNLRRYDFIGTLEYRIADASNYTIYQASEECEISALSSKRLCVRDLSNYINGHENEYYLEYYLKETASAISRKTLLFVPEKHFDFKKPKLKTVITGKERSFSITISSDVFVKDLEVSFDGVDATFSDNYIDLTSEAPVKMSFTVKGGIQTTYHLKDALNMRSVYDLK